MAARGAGGRVGPGVSAGAAVVSAVVGLALVTALEPDEVPVGTEPADLETTTEEMVTPSAVPSP